MLISYSLVQSAAYPAPSALDHNLHALVFAPKESLEHLALIDDAAAQMLHTYMTGYATLRRFYDIRDEAANPPGSETSKQGPPARKTASSTAPQITSTAASSTKRAALWSK